MTLPVQEALICPFLDEKERFHVAIVLRQGYRCFLLTRLSGLVAAATPSQRGIQIIEETLRLPCRVIDGQEGAFLAQHVMAAEKDGSGSYLL